MSGMETAAEPRRPRVVHLTSAHRSDDPRIFGKECLSLARAGYDVSIVAPEDRPVKRRNQAVDVIPVKRRSGRLGRMLASTVAVTVAGLRQRAALYHFHDPELIPAGLMLRLLGKHVIYDAHEDVPRDILFKDWLPSYLRRPASVMATAGEWIAGRTLSGIVAATPTIARRFPNPRTALVQNYARLSEFASPEETQPNDHFSIAYVGAVSVERCAVEMVEAIARVERFPELRLVVAGEMESPALLRRLTSLKGWPRVDYRGFQPRPEVRGILAGARAGLALFHPVQSYVESQPVKIFEYMAMGLPVVAANFPGFRDIVEENGCGICVPPRDPAAIADAIEWILEHPAAAEEMGRRGRKCILDTFNWEGEAERLLHLYERVLA